jgi:hypothetical protein
MTALSRLGRALGLALALAAPLRATDDGVVRYVVLDSTRLLASPAAFSKTLAKLAKGQALRAWPARTGYLKVSVMVGDAPKTGFVALRSLMDHRPRLTSNASASTDASAHEMAAATKGFNQQIEDDRRAKDTAGGYARLDLGLARTTMADPLAETEAFRRAGSLGEFKEGGR